VWKLDRDPLVTTWIALDPATRLNGCVEVIPGTHRLGLLTTAGSTLRQEDVERYCPADAIEYLEIEAGECLLLHNWLVHSSDVNRTDIPRRALSACYMDGRTVGTLNGDRFPIVLATTPGPGRSPSGLPPRIVDSANLPERRNAMRAAWPNTRIAWRRCVATPSSTPNRSRRRSHGCAPR